MNIKEAVTAIRERAVQSIAMIDDETGERRAAAWSFSSGLISALECMARNASGDHKAMISEAANNLRELLKMVKAKD